MRTGLCEPAELSPNVREVKDSCRQGGGGSKIKGLGNTTFSNRITQVLESNIHSLQAIRMAIREHIQLVERKVKRKFE